MNDQGSATDSTLYRTLAQTVYLATGVFLVLAFLDAATVTMLFLLLAVILAMALNELAGDFLAPLVRGSQMNLHHVKF